MSDTRSDNPPKGDFEKADKYISQLVNLLNENKIEVYHTDLKRFDPTTLQDHYTISLKDYQIEISHSKQPNSGKDSYVMIFNNMKQISEGSQAKVILAYIYLADSQFSKFKMVADRFIEDKRKIEEEKRFNAVMQPIDQLLDEVSGQNASAHPRSDNSNPLMQNMERELDFQLDKTDHADHDDLHTPQIHQV